VSADNSCQPRKYLSSLIIILHHHRDLENILEVLILLRLHHPIIEITIMLEQVAHILSNHLDSLRKSLDALQCSVKCPNGSADTNHRDLVFAQLSG
jgi:hypothetical protein